MGTRLNKLCAKTCAWMCKQLEQLYNHDESYDLKTIDQLARKGKFT